MRLSKRTVNTIFKDCITLKAHLPKNEISVEGVLSKFGFDAVKINEHKEEIYLLLKELPSNFKKGDLFPNGVYDKNGNQWTDLYSVLEELFCLGIAIGKCKAIEAREVWQNSPEKTPRFVIL